MNAVMAGKIFMEIDEKGQASLFHADDAEIRSIVSNFMQCNFVCIRSFSRCTSSRYANDLVGLLPDSARGEKSCVSQLMWGNLQNGLEKTWCDLQKVANRA